MAFNYNEHICADPELRFGSPVITGTRISVFDVLSWLASGMSEEEILEDFPELTAVQIRACLAYAADRVLSDTETALIKKGCQDLKAGNSHAHCDVMEKIKAHIERKRF